MTKQEPEHLNPTAAKWVAEGWEPNCQDDHEWATGTGQYAPGVRVCSACGSTNIVNVTPYDNGPGRYGERCKDCGHFRDISAEAEAEADEEYRRMTGQEPPTDAEIAAAMEAERSIEAVGLMQEGPLTTVRLTPNQFTAEDDTRYWLLEIPAIPGETQEWAAMLHEAHVAQLAEALKRSADAAEPERGREMSKPMNDKWLDTLAQEIALGFRTITPGPISVAALRNAQIDLAYLISEFKRLRAALEHAEQQARISIKMMALAVDAKKRAEGENASMRPIVEAVSWSPDGKSCTFCGYPLASDGFDRWHTAECVVLKARAYLAAHPADHAEAGNA